MDWILDPPLRVKLWRVVQKDAASLGGTAASLTRRQGNKDGAASLRCVGHAAEKVRCVCVCVCVPERGREERNMATRVQVIDR